LYRGLDVAEQGPVGESAIELHPFRPFRWVDGPPSRQAGVRSGLEQGNRIG
jgi:hypothetical protein